MLNPMSIDDQRRIHFIDDIDEGDGDDEYECQRCGYVAEGKWEIRYHRKGIVSQCAMKRFRMWLSQYV